MKKVRNHQIKIKCQLKINSIREPVELNLPLGSIILTVQDQNRNAYIHVLVDVGETETESRFLRIVQVERRESSVIMPDSAQYIGTVQAAHGSDGAYHFFEVFDHE